MCVHQEGQRHLEGFVDLERIEGQPKGRIHARHGRQDSKAAEGQVKVEMSDRIDQAAV